MSENYANTFMSKLKEQSFTILILVGIMYYQNTLFTSQMKISTNITAVAEGGIDDL